MSEGFRVRQFFMRDYCEEPSVLHSLTAYLARFDVLITYNGKTFDQPLLETRYTMCRARHPFAAWSISISSTARAACSNCVSKAAAW